MSEILHLPELLLNILSYVKRDSRSFTRCLRVNKTWREIVIENAHQLLDENTYIQCQGAIVKVSCSDDQANSLECRVPGYQAQLLAIAGAIEGVANRLVFRSRDIAVQWFQTARRYIDVNPQNRPSPLTSIDWPGIERANSFVGGKLMAPVIRPKTGQLWFWVWDTAKNNSLNEAKEEVLKGFKSTEPHVVVGAAGLGLIGFDGRDRLWFKLGLSELVHGLSEDEYVTLESKTRAEAGLPERKDGSKYRDYFHTGEINGNSESICVLDHENRFYISDSIGVHIIHPDTRNHFDYHSTYKVNYEKNVFYEGKEVFYTLYKYVDVTGKLFVWSTSGCNGWSGTVGYWTFDGKQWKNIDLVHDAIYNIAVRVLQDRRQIWLLLAKDIKILEEPLSGDASPAFVSFEELMGFAPSQSHSRAVAQSADRHESVVFALTKAILLNSKYKERKPQTLNDDAFKALRENKIDTTYSRSNTILDGVIYFTEGTKIVAVSLDGKTVTNFPCTETMSNPQVIHAFMKPRKYGKPIPMVYLRGGNMTYLLDTCAKFVDFTGVPAVNFNLKVGASSPSPAGHVYIFEPKLNYYEWQATQLPQTPPGAFESLTSCRTDVIYGNDGLMIICDENKSMFITQNGQCVKGQPEELIDKHYEVLIKHLPFPPHRSFAKTNNIVHDGLGNIWFTDSHNLSVRTPGGFIRLDTKIHCPSTKDLKQANIFAMAPLGNGSAVVSIEEYKSLVLKINQQKKSFDVVDTPIDVHYKMHTEEWRDNVFYDKRGEVYTINEEWSMDYKANGMHYKTYQLLKSPMKVLVGKLLLIDRHNGKWFYHRRINANFPSVLIYRPDQGTAEFKLELSLSVEMLGEDFAVDHSVWLCVDGGLTRVKFNGTALEVTEQLKMVVQNSIRTAVSNGRHVMWSSNSYESCSCLVLEEKHFI